MSESPNLGTDRKKPSENPDGLDRRALPFKHEISVQEGIIVLVDISGFTSFVKKIDPLIGFQVIHDLLSAIPIQNEFGLHVNEIEGDAILFYKIGVPLTMKNYSPI